MTIREKVARAVASSQMFAWGLNYDTALKDDKEHCAEIGTAANTAFLEAAAEQGWHMQPGEATREMVNSADEAGYHASDGVWNDKELAREYRAMLAAAPEFEWDG